MLTRPWGYLSLEFIDSYSVEGLAKALKERVGSNIYIAFRVLFSPALSVTAL